jgi:hypothetical protein
MGIEGLNFQVIPVAFTKGQDTRTQSKLVLPGKWLSLINYSPSEDNTPRRRDGSSVLVNGATGNGLFTRGSELLTISGPVVKSYSSAAGSLVSVTGTPGYVGISKTEVQRSTGMQDSPDVASSGSLTCYVWRAKSSVNAIVGFAMSLIDEKTGTLIQANVALHSSVTSDWIRVVATTDAFYVVYRDGNQIFGRVVTFASPSTLGAETSLVNSASMGGVCAGDACAFNNMAMVVFPWTDGTTSVESILVTRTGAVPSVFSGPTQAIDQTSLQVAGVTSMTCAVFGNATNAGVVATGNLGTKSGITGAIFNTSLTRTSGPTRLDNTVSTTTSPNHIGACAEPGTATQMRVFRDFFSELNTNALNAIQEIIFDTSLTVHAGPFTVNPSATFGAGVVARGPQGPFIHGKPFTNGTNVFLSTFVFSIYNNASGASANPRTANAQNTFFLIDCGTGGGGGSFTTPSVCGRALYGSLGIASVNGVNPAVSTCSSPAISGSTTFAVLAGELTLLVLSSGNNISPTGLVRLTLTPNTSTPLSRAELGESAYLAGGQLSMYDGQSLSEQCFPLFPEGIGCTAGGAGTGSMIDGVHQVVAIYSWIDNAGQRHLSAPSLPVTVTVNSGGANTGSILVSVPTLLVSQKAGVEILFYCTVASGLTFFRSLNTGVAGYLPLQNSTAANALSTWRIVESDTALSANEVLYTQPNFSPTTLPSLAPAPCTYVWTAHNRLWFDKADKPGWFGYSQEYVNNVGLQFNDSLEDSLPTTSGGFVAGAEMDEKVVLFGRERIYVKFGTGPQPSGAFNNYTRAEDVKSDVGCSDPLSVMPMSKGIIFKSESGFHLLGRDLSVTYIGEGVKVFDGYTITSATLMQDRQEIRFEAQFSPSNSGDGVVLVFSTLLGEWSVFYRGSNLLHPDGAIDAMWYPVLGRYVFLLNALGSAPGLYEDVPLFDADGVATGADPDDYVGVASATVTTFATTSWLRGAVLEGFQRIRRLFITGTPYESPMDSSFNISVQFDDDPASPLNYTVATPLSGTSQTIDLRHELAHQKCKSVRFVFRETGDGSGQTGVLSGIQALALEIGLKKGVNKLPASQTV